MHIKSIIIRGFKSYKDEVRMVDLSKHHNAIIGQNGTGKSNFFDAIRFVLCDDKFYNMSHAERQHLLYEGPGVNDVLSAFVEIHFDNSDARFPIDRSEVVLRRTIGLKKDEYFLDKKHVTKQDVVSLLESAGFSRSNPYYIVQQGKVNALALMKDEQRLDLLKEVAGTKVYEQRRAESTKIMQDTESKRAKIAELLLYFDSRLADLDAEKKELEAYRNVQIERRAVEHAYYEKQFGDTVARIEECDAARADELERAGDAHERAADARAALAEREAQLVSERRAAARHAAAVERLAAERSALAAQRAELALAAQEANSDAKQRSSELKELNKELKQTRSTIDSTERRLGKATSDAERAVAAEAELRAALQAGERRLTELYAKQGRKQHFKSAAARDKWLKEQLALADKRRAELAAQADASRADVARIEASLDENKKRTAARETGVAERRKLGEAAAKALAELKAERDTAAAQRKELWRDDAASAAALHDWRQELASAERALSSAVARPVAAGLAAVRRIAAEQRIDGVYGPLIELISAKPEYAAAIEVAARGALFHVVVASDEVAAKVLRAFNDEKVNGRVSFLPLNRLHTPDHDYPQSPDVKPLVDEITCEPMFAPAVRHVFGRTLLCRKLEVAAMSAKQYKFDCITPDGDQVERRGALTGGFVDPRKSWLVSMAHVKECRTKVATLAASQDKNSAALGELDSRISELLGEIERRSTEVVAMRDAVDQLLHDLRMLARERATLEAALPQRRAAAQAASAAQLDADAAADTLRAELGTPLRDELPPAEAKELARLETEQTERQHQLTDARSKATSASAALSELTALLGDNLRRREAELEAQLARLALPTATSTDAAAPSVDAQSVSLIESSLTKLDERLQVERTAVDKCNARVVVLEQEIAKLATGDHDTARTLQAESTVIEKLMQQRSALQRQRDEYARKIRELGALPTGDKATAFAKLTQTELLKKLKAANKKLKKYSHVNKKALDQYVNFVDQRASLVARRDELDEAALSIDHLIASLDRKKDEAIERTFKATAKHFAQVFSELVPDGKASLIMQTRDPNAIDSSSQSVSRSAAGDTSRVSRYTGIGVRVSFAEGTETVHIQQLSGGQKSLVALALVFAIQRSDPNPFYLFDEVDAALDTNYRTAVANLIRAQSRETQFVTTTFKEELAEHANTFFGIRFNEHKVSKVMSIKKAQAMQLINNAQQIDRTAR